MPKMMRNLRVKVAKAPTLKRPTLADYRMVAPDALGIKAFETLTLSTPEEHAQYEMTPLREPEHQPTPHGMPWENGGQDLRALKNALQNDMTPNGLFKAVVARTAEECFKEGEFPQRSDGWFNARKYAVTASQFGSAASHNKYQSADKFLQTKVFPKSNPFLGSEYTQWGVDHEVHAEEAFVKSFLDARAKSLYNIDHPKICKHPDAPWLAFSPDGILRRKDGDADVIELIEYKAPAFHRNKQGHPYHSEAYKIPKSYMDQMQGSMWLMRNLSVYPRSALVDRAWFVCWQPHAVHITHVPYCPDYANKLIEVVKAFYFDRFLPKCITAAEAALAVEEARGSNPVQSN